jgi:hypothetical protein
MSINPSTGATERILLDPAVVDRSRPLLKAVLAAVGWANSWATTTLSAMWIEQQITGQATWVSMVIGAIVAIVLTVGQVYTLRASGGGYLFCLLPDVGLTAIQHQRWLVPIFRLLLGEWGGLLVGWLLALWIGERSARLPERLVFGRR